MIDAVHEQIVATSALEWVAVLLALGYLVLAIGQSVWCWPCAFVSTGIYIYLYGSVELYMESALNVFYLLVAIYGFWYWWQGGVGGATATVQRLAARWHVIAIAVIVILVVFSGKVLQAYTEQAYPYVDAMTTWSAVWATWLTARKIIENWWYWLVIDVVSVWLFWTRGLALTSVLFVVYVCLIPFGYQRWRRSEQALI
ncbi:MAG: nicotinamide riboside transporter PnuC [Woeseiaceae bacterium]